MVLVCRGNSEGATEEARCGFRDAWPCGANRQRLFGIVHEESERDDDKTGNACLTDWCL